jgi:tetratricopeptide (TPR) repeat protein
MAARFLRFRLAGALVALLAGVLMGVPASAQSHRGRDWVQPPSQLPPVEPTYSLDTLFSALKVAPDEATAKEIESRIWATWMVSGSDTCNLLMERAKAATEARDYDLALKLLDAIVEIKPDYLEARNRRATIYYLKDDYGRAMADLAQVLAREPRHFGALSGLGLMLEEIGDDKDALSAYRKALSIDPHLEHIPEVVRTLSEKVEGRPI